MPPVNLPRTIVTLLSLAMALAMASCTPSQPDGQDNANANDNTDDPAGKSLTGQLVFFSGRPPPEWTIPEGEHAEIALRLEGLTPAEEPASFPRFGPVGYRIVNDSGVAGIPDGVLVQEGVVQVHTAESYSYFLDDKQLEAFLQASSKTGGAYAQLGLDDSAGQEGQ